VEAWKIRKKKCLNTLIWLLNVTQPLKGILVSSNLPKNEPNFCRTFALISKMGKIKKINHFIY
jgi:hypothetical protein